jgi:spore germination protein YaaH
MLRAITVLAIGSAAITAAAVLPASAAAQHRHALEVTAFQNDFDAPKLIDASKTAITTVGVDGVSVKGSGAAVTKPSDGARANLRRANHDELPAELLVNNYSNSVGDFSEPLAHRMLGNKDNIDAVVDQLVTDVQQGGWDGISVDLESLKPRDADGLSQFVRELGNQLPSRASLSICIMSATHAHDYYAEWGYHLKQLAHLVDRVMLMTYDEHGPWEDTPGPIGALSWQRRSVAAALHLVSKNKLDLGVAGYGYAWGGPDGNRQLTVAQARDLAGDQAQFDKKVGEWTATLDDGTVLWWSDVRSYKLRVNLARELDLHGLAMWALGSSDPLP